MYTVYINACKMAAIPKDMCLFLPQSSIYSITLKSVISISTLILLGLIMAYHCCEVQVTQPVILYITSPKLAGTSPKTGGLFSDRGFIEL